MAGERQILTWAVAHLPHHSNIPSFQYSVIGVFHHSIAGPGESGERRM